MFIFDSDVLIEFLRGRLPDGFELMKQTDSRLIKIPAIVEMELRVGANKSDSPLENNAIVDKLLFEYDVLSFDSRCARAAARIRSQLESQGRKIGPNDYSVAATALVYGGTLVTNNVREFKRVTGLQLLSLHEADF